jgi:hypothetical protein
LQVLAYQIVEIILRKLFRHCIGGCERVACVAVVRLKLSKDFDACVLRYLYFVILLLLLIRVASSVGRIDLCNQTLDGTHLVDIRVR